MTMLSGVIAAATTPIDARGEIDPDRLVGHCGWLLETGGCDAVNLLGTTGEATSFSVRQRLAAMTTISQSGLPMDRFMVGTGAAAIADAIALTQAADDLGFAGALLVPPFYYKGVGEGALIGYVQRIIDAVRPGKAGLYLYHIPQFSGVPYPIDAVERLADGNPDILRGVKDSSGDLSYARELARRVPKIAVFPSSEGTLASADEHGFAGCISATTNVNGALAQVAWRSRGTAAGREAGAEALAVRETLSKFPLVPAVKWAVSTIHHDPVWKQPQPPLVSLTPDQGSDLERALSALK
ncbi:dihydrodipicolinate synthase family protein [Methylobacterium sp. NEAU 140]|uniref:dihydrodipicolinate synthase family protein n=1 Tax=Methylobacterium sp. NEAU 140 TaxID=3064945 RepID=UPI0027362110|nr:dihydrodipicolinate synthase family protein [Methylobacterium sp. NEAU 140]MDP4021922.1 dihydrodipicolinate synthase family protein [Methylobacterium sp. NEAU 140]